MSDLKSESAFTFPAVDKSDHRYLLTVKNLNNRAVACRQQNDLKSAIENYNEALRIDRESAVLYNNRGVVWLKKKEFEQAISDFDSALKIEPDLGLAYYNRGIAWRAKKSWIAPLLILRGQ